MTSLSGFENGFGASRASQTAPRHLPEGARRVSNGTVDVATEARIPGDICQDATGPAALNMTFTVEDANRAGGKGRVRGVSR